MRDPMFEAIARSLEEQSKTPPLLRFQQMVDRGAIDKDGNVLLKMPEFSSIGTSREKVISEITPSPK